MYNVAKINSDVLLNNTITIQPSVTKGLLTISSIHEMQTIEVTNSAAQLIVKKACTDKVEQLQLQDLSDDICFVRVLYPNGMSVTKKVMIHKSYQ